MKKGNTIFFNTRPKVRSYAAVCGSKEREGVIGSYADITLSDDMYGESTYEKAECKMLSDSIALAIKKSALSDADVDVLLSGDLLNQIISASFAARAFEFPFLGLYSACSTMSEGMLLAAALVDGGYARNCVAATGSHFASAERQYRYPLELGCTRPPQSQWTVTGAGACVISSECGGIEVVNATLGRVRDWGVSDVNNMGAAMAPAAFDTIRAHLRETGRDESYYDMIVTGDLGRLGRELLVELMQKDGVGEGKNVNDCGCMVFAPGQKCGLGGSGAGCSSLVYCAYLHKLLVSGQLNRLLLAPTGALLSKDSSLQGESIPGIAYAVAIECR